MNTFLLALTLWVVATYGSSFPTTTCWPLCGRVPIGTASCDITRCGSCLFHDLPIDNTYGPRTKGSSGNRYDWYRGLDIKTDVNSSLFAITSGEVEDIQTSSTDGISIQLQHFRSGIRGNCSAGCYFSRYLHASATTLHIGDWVETGRLIGYSGMSSSGNAHLHFEIRSANTDDAESDWQRECVNPFRVLAYCPDMEPRTNIELVKWNKISVTSNRKDIVRIELELKDMNGAMIATAVANEYGYDVNPTFLDIEAMNFQYTHKDSSVAEWESFGLNGVHQCPYYSEHGLSYDANLHLDVQSVNNQSVGQFNGLMIFPYDEEDYFWGMAVTFVVIGESVHSLVQCTVVNVYSAEFGTLGTHIVNSTDFGNCVADTGTALFEGNWSNKIYCIMFLICTYHCMC